MEKVWEDINLDSLHHAAADTHHRSFHGVSLQDFLSGPVSSKDPEPPRNIVINDSPHEPSPTRYGGEATIFGSLQLPPATALSLRPGPTEFHYLRSPVRTMSHPQSQSPSDGTGALSFITSSAVSFPSACKKGAWENGDNPSDRRHKRMIKNRESADRSRARKQAYRTELEKEVARLTKENAMIRRQLEKLGAAASGQIPKKHSTLHRASTVPF